MKIEYFKNVPYLPYGEDQIVFDTENERLSFLRKSNQPEIEENTTVFFGNPAFLITSKNLILQEYNYLRIEDSATPYTIYAFIVSQEQASGGTFRIFFELDKWNCFVNFHKYGQILSENLSHPEIKGDVLMSTIDYGRDTFGVEYAQYIPLIDIKPYSGYGEELSITPELYYAVAVINTHYDGISIVATSYTNKNDAIHTALKYLPNIVHYSERKHEGVWVYSNANAIRTYVIPAGLITLTNDEISIQYLDVDSEFHESYTTMSVARVSRQITEIEYDTEQVAGWTKQPNNSYSFGTFNHRINENVVLESRGILHLYAKVISAWDSDTFICRAYFGESQMECGDDFSIDFTQNEMAISRAQNKTAERINKLGGFLKLGSSITNASIGVASGNPIAGVQGLQQVSGAGLGILSEYAKKFEYKQNQIFNDGAGIANFSQCNGFYFEKEFSQNNEQILQSIERFGFFISSEKSFNVVYPTSYFNYQKLKNVKIFNFPINASQKNDVIKYFLQGVRIWKSGAYNP